MATSFLGLPVLVKLRTGSQDSVQGILSSLDPGSGTLTLTEARSFIRGVDRLEGIRVLGRAEVAGLELLSVQRGSEPEPALDRSTSSSTRTSAGSQRALQQSQLQPASPVPSPSNHALTERTWSGRGQRRRQGGNRSQTGTPTRIHQPPVIQNGIDEDFDFSAGLASFDKKAVFADIKSQDATDPSLRLHAHNRNPSRTPQTKLLPTESVLSPQELYDQQQESQVIRENKQTKIASMTPTDMHAGDLESRLAVDDSDDKRNEQRWESITGEIEKIALGDGNNRSEFRTKGGRKVPVVKPKQWREALAIAETEATLTPTQRLESSAAALTSYILTRRLVTLPARTDARPTVCILATESDRGYVALRAAAILVYRGCRVVVLALPAAESAPDIAELYRNALRAVGSAGARIVRDAEDLPTKAALVIDALASTPKETQPAIAWSNGLRNATVLALDVPTESEAEAGTPAESSPLVASAILAFGLPRPGLLQALARHACPVTLADVGLPPSIWDRVGVEDYDVSMWGTEVLLDIELGGSQ